MIDILFVHPNASKKIYQDLATNHSAIEPPIWAGMLANSVRIAGYSTGILDCEVEGLNLVSAEKRIQEYKPRIVCIVVYGQQPSASSQNMTGASALAKQIKEINPDTFVLLVGGHVAALPSETLAAESSVDAVCQNEGIYTIRALLQVSSLRNDGQLKLVDGLAFRDSEGNVLVNKPSRIVSKKDLEMDLPGVAWDLLPDLKRYRTAGWH
jgi:hypothetical protein